MKILTVICLMGWAFLIGAKRGAEYEMKRANIKLQHAHDVITSGTGRKHANGAASSKDW